jgi:hypothetical protein
MAFKMGDKPLKKLVETPVTPEPDIIDDVDEVDEFAHLNGALARGAAVGASELPPVVEAPPATPGAPQVNTDAMAALAAMIGQQVATAVTAAQPVKRMTFGEYQRRAKKGRLTLKRVCWNNGIMIQESVLTNREIELLNQITHTGRYVNRLVEVIVRDEGADEVVELRWNMKRDAQFELKGSARNFCDILEQIVAAQVEERAEAEAKDERAQARRQKRA